MGGDMDRASQFNVPDEMSRRRFIATTAVTAAGGLAIPGLLHASESPASSSGGSPIIDVPQNAPLELVVSGSRLAVAGRSTGSPITVNGTLPGPTLRMREGQDVEIHVRNDLPDEDTSIHWHGLILPATMDGVPGVSFAGIKPGESFTYKYRLRQNGTYWYHSHSGLQEQLGHFGALIVDPVDPEPFSYDSEYVVILSDWMFRNPYRVLKKLKKFSGYFNYQRPTVANLISDANRDGLGNVLSERLRWDFMRMDPTDIADITGVAYTYLMNGRSPDENWSAIVSPGERIRLRIINAATMTYFDFRIPGLPMTVVAADGQHVKPVDTDELRIAVAETYDVLVTIPDDRAYTLFAETMDRSGFARGTLAPGEGVQAAVPERRERAMRTMADMGMARMAGKSCMGGMGGVTGMDANAMPMDDKGKSKHDPGRDMPGMSDDRGATDEIRHDGELPTENLPESVKHSSDHHGTGATMVAMMPRRRYTEPGLGLGSDGWRVLTYSDLRALRQPADRRAPTRQFDLHLTGNMDRYIWGFDGKKYSEAKPIRFIYGERLRINMINDTMMDHPIHLHGMWMDLYAGGTLADNPRKHTVSVKPGELLSVDITADAPGRWAFHCHLLFHMDMGMFRTVAVVRSLDEGVSS
jgi:CopA family copper-resistance protein